MKEYHDWHDRLYKDLFSKPLFVEIFLKSFVKGKFIDYLDFSRVKTIGTEFISKELKKYESDMILEIYYKDRPIYLLLMLEFQTTVDHNMPLRFLRYIVELYWNIGRNSDSGEYPAVFPVLIYTGDQKWTVESNFAEQVERIEYGDDILTFKYYPIIVNQLSRKKLLKLKNAFTVLFTMENTPKMDYYKIYKDMVYLIKELLEDEQTEVLYWLNCFFEQQHLKMPPLNLEDLQKPEEVIDMMYTADAQYDQELINKGIHQGIEQGKEIRDKEFILNMYNAGSEIRYISEVSGYSIDKIKDIIKKADVES